jgi:hypothetical protein
MVTIQGYPPKLADRQSHVRSFLQYIIVFEDLQGFFNDQALNPALSHGRFAPAGTKSTTRIEKRQLTGYRSPSRFFPCTVHLMFDDADSRIAVHFWVRMAIANHEFRFYSLANLLET